MIAMDRGRGIAPLLAVLTAGLLMGQRASAENKFFGRPPAAQPAQPVAPPTRPDRGDDVPRLVPKEMPANPTDPIAVVNEEPITRQQLADECVVRKGQEILETMIARKLIEQAMRARKLEVTAQEVDEEIDAIAQRMAGVSRDVWLRTLDKERGISPAQYARDIIYPSLALRKLATPRVQVTDQDIRDAFEANFGARLRCRLIMTDQPRKATEIWEEIKKNPDGFEKLAKERSMDTGTRSLGGLLAEPMARHAYPRTVSDAAFRELVDGDPKDTNPAHKPKDGDFTGPIQVSEGAWIILKRESVEPAKNQNPADPNVQTLLKAQMFDVKLKDAMNELFAELTDAAAIENKLMGTFKLASEKKNPEYPSDVKVKRMSAAGETPSTLSNTAGRSLAPRTPTTGPTTAPPAGVPNEAAKAADRLKGTIQTAPPGQAAPRR